MAVTMAGIEITEIVLIRYRVSILYGRYRVPISDIRQSQNYIWSTKDILGKGATSVVYRGINRITGAFAAVKTFHNFFTPREFEVLKKINHENIVKLLAIETEEERTLRNKDKPKRQILVTELCTGGCLSDILEDPENIYGLEDAEFLKVLAHLYEGMKYLRDNDIIHRDLKPGNIMKFIKDDGTSVYKLIDFGAARELSDEKDFKSLYGTEEYLYPDMYERAILGVHGGKTFRATVDLWSIGVTLYHVATGELPFRPFGGRRNRDTMHYITSQKGSGVISGVQLRQNGPIRWETELPKNCLLSDGLKKIITSLIAGLLELDESKMWSFEQFFSDVRLILSMKLVHVFHVTEAGLIKVYLKPDDESSPSHQLQENIAKQTHLAPDNQILMHKNDLVHNDTPSTSSEDFPIFLFSKESAKLAIAPLEAFPKTITFTKPIDFREDTKLAKLACISGYKAKRYIEQKALDSKLICQAVENMSDYINHKFEKMKQDLQHLLEKAQTLKRTAEIFEVSQQISNYALKTGSSEALKQIDENYNSKDDATTVRDMHEKHCVENYLRSRWDTACKDLKKPFDTRCTARAKILVDELKDSRLHLGQGRDYPVSHTDQYMMERKKIEDTLDRLVALLETEVHPQHAKLTEELEDWWKTPQVDFLKIEILSANIKEYQRNLEQFEEKLVLDIDGYNEFLKSNKPRSKQQENIKQLKIQLKHYKCKTETFNNNMIEENSKLRNLLKECVLEVNENKFVLEELELK